MLAFTLYTDGFSKMLSLFSGVQEVEVLDVSLSIRTLLFSVQGSYQLLSTQTHMK